MIGTVGLLFTAVTYTTGHSMEWNGNFGMEDARMEWKTIFHTFIPIPYSISRIAFTEKHSQPYIVRMSGGDK